MESIKGIAGALLFAALLAPAHADAKGYSSGVQNSGNFQKITPPEVSSHADVAVAPLPDGVPQTTLRSLSNDLAIGDLIFIRVSAKPFREVAAATNSWTNHVGVVVSVTGREPLVGESTVPLSRTTTLSKFVRRSERRRLAVARLSTTLTEEQQQRVIDAARRRYGVFYDTGFDLQSICLGSCSPCASRSCRSLWFFRRALSRSIQNYVRQDK